MAELSALAYAPATVGNLAVGFDLLGHCIDGLGDRVRAHRVERVMHGPRAQLGDLSGLVIDLPLSAESNTATVAASALLEAVDAPFDVRLDLIKGIPLCSGLGGSAASASAAVVATNALLPTPLPQEALYPYAMAGEAIASGEGVGDNVGPQLLGGLVLATPNHLTPLPVPGGLTAAVVHPRQRIATKAARAVLQTPFELGDIIRQQTGLAQLMVGLFRGDFTLIRNGLTDHLIEPRRLPLIPGGHLALQSARQAGALGASISGAGPSLFAWFTDSELAKQGALAMTEAFEKQGVESHSYISPVAASGAHLIEA